MQKIKIPLLKFWSIFSYYLFINISSVIDTLLKKSSVSKQSWNIHKNGDQIGRTIKLFSYQNWLVSIFRYTFYRKKNLVFSKEYSAVFRTQIQIVKLYRKLFFCGGKACLLLIEIDLAKTFAYLWDEKTSL